MTLPKELTTVTTISKTLALYMFIMMPIIGFLLGMKYQENIDATRYTSETPIMQTPGHKTPLQRACTMDAKLCPDGSAVGRSGPNCEFAPCPPAKVQINQ